MVKSLANELNDILEWIQKAGLGETEHARSALVAFCRGLVCGLQMADKEPFVADEKRPNKSETDWAAKNELLWEMAGKAAMRERMAEARHRHYDENSQLRPADECDRVMPGSIPSKD